jgi:hypothetical protein
MVVGIGYPFSTQWANRMLDEHFHGADRPIGTLQAIGAAAGLARIYDLSLPADPAALGLFRLPNAPEQRSSDVGGLDDFLQIIETEIKPLVAELAKVDASNQVLFGHSLGGLAALHALFTEPGAFRTFIVASPSIWWADRAVLKGELAFRASILSGEARPRVLVTMGALEGEHPAHVPLPPGVPREALSQMFSRSRMVETGRELTARLKSLTGAPPFEVGDYLVFPDQGHGISAWSALAAGIGFAFQRP